MDLADGKKKELRRAEGKLTASMTDAKESIATLADEIKELLPKQLPTARWKIQDFKTLFASDSAAEELLASAKNCLNKFYNPKLYKPEEAMMAQVRAHDAPPPPGAYQKKSEDSGGVISMIDLIAELDKELTEAKTEEELAQEE